MANPALQTFLAANIAGQKITADLDSQKADVEYKKQLTSSAQQTAQRQAALAETEASFQKESAAKVSELNDQWKQKQVATGSLPDTDGLAQFNKDIERNRALAELAFSKGLVEKGNDLQKTAESMTLDRSKAEERNLKTAASKAELVSRTADFYSREAMTPELMNEVSTWVAKELGPEAFMALPKTPEGVQQFLKRVTAGGLEMAKKASIEAKAAEGDKNRAVTRESILARTEKADADRKARAQLQLNKLTADANKIGTKEDRAPTAKSIAEYGARMPSGRFLATPAGLALMADVLELNPAYDIKEFDAKTKLIKDATSGRMADRIRSFGVLKTHLNVFDETIDALESGNVRQLNKADNYIRKEFGSPAPTNFAGVRKLVAGEVIRAVTGGPGALADREEVAADFDAANSYPQLKGLMKYYQDLASGQLEGAENQYKTAFPERTDFKERFLSNFKTAFHKDAKETQPQKGVPAGFPSISPELQQARDKDAVGILRDELAIEKAKLATATGEAKTRSQSFVASLEREIAAKSKGQPSHENLATGGKSSPAPTSGKVGNTTIHNW